ncbi:MAG: hypothetical protein A2Z34_10510 [Planctomycetes bacterium RBG_16_59_8]|nr:MAG: hypothetical protein A2Z34_10510 [Planctomycetes bacterium RBG_16_59_8]
MASGITVDIDKRADIVYLTLGTGEPSYCEEFDDFVLIERGIYSQLITGVRILNFSKTKSGTIEFNGKTVKRLLIREREAFQRLPHMEDRSQRISRLLKTIERGPICGRA